MKVIMDNLPFLMRGLVLTAELTAVAVIAGTCCGVGLALARLARAIAVRAAATWTIEAVRATPVLMLIFWFYFMMPRLLGHPVKATVAGFVALTVYNAAYSAEIVRAGIRAVSVGQVEAARSTGLSSWSIFRHIVLPQAMANMAPALINQAVNVFKTSSLVYVIGVVEFFEAATIVNNREFRPYEVFAFVAVVYFVPSTVGSRISRALRMRRAEALGGVLTRLQ